MSSTKAVQGRNVILRIKSATDGLYYPYACATNVDIAYTFELILKTSPGDGRAKKYRPRSTDGTVSLEGVTAILPVGMWSVFDLLEKAMRGDYIDLQMEFTNNAGDVKTLSCTVLASEVDLSATADGLSQFTINFQMTGASDVFSIPVPGDGGGGIPPDDGGGGIPPEDGGTGITTGPIRAGRYAGGTTSWTDASTIGKTVLYVYRNDMLQIITSGSPTPKQVLFNSTTGTFTLNSPLDSTIGEAAFYLFG
jgi:hypothetical protein